MTVSLPTAWDTSFFSEKNAEWASCMAILMLEMLETEKPIFPAKTKNSNKKAKNVKLNSKNYVKIPIFLYREHHIKEME